VLIIVMGMMGLGLGMLISSMVTKYRDLTYLVAFGVQLMMYLSAVTYPMALIREKMPNYAWIVDFNPMAHIIEISRHMLLGTGEFSISSVIYSLSVAILLFFVGLLVFNHTEKTFIDTV